MVALLVSRPIYLAVEAVVKGQIGVQPCAIRIKIVWRKFEGVFAVVEVANFQISIDLIEHLPAQRNVLDLRATDPLYPDRPLAGREGLTSNGEHRSALEQGLPLDFKNDC